MIIKTLFTTFSLLFSAPLWAQLQCGQMNPGDVLHTGESFWSCGQQFELTLQGDGNLVEYLHISGGRQPLWSSATNVVVPPGISSQCVPAAANSNFHPLCGTGYGYGRYAPGGHLVVQTDGNIVLYDANGNPSWATMTNGYNGSTLNLQGADGNLVVYHGSPNAIPNPAVWSWFTGCIPQMSNGVPGPAAYGGNVYGIASAMQNYYGAPFYQLNPIRGTLQLMQ